MDKILKKIAFFISTIGHPLILGTLYVILISSHELDPLTALIISAIVICLITIPITVHNWIKLRKGHYSNFDVSDKEQRKGFYPFSILLFVACFATFYILDLPKVVLVTTFFFTLMLFIMAIVNENLKASLHIAIAAFILAKILSLSWLFGGSFLIFVFLIGWSRWFLGRHSQEELLVGAIIGTLCGWLTLFF
ncbi:phosphatase PAP2 family protein [Belliella kenyensis]|uniref:Phosphatase PAP2 family protein n=1 Tax=Belliella kenyensis TaxID=1472724 RepID=A0ABV8ELH5_9BACT|nr:phosphatase PAP2 family protein [Belliella kenyensis]MCH7400568.1 phosphatase PAP2 family protein [Belliella kenyensis]MDN3602145.1 phosphatase PAP2 family protein [Belliella kenyensis]